MTRHAGSSAKLSIFLAEPMMAALQPVASSLLSMLRLPSRSAIFSLYINSGWIWLSSWLWLSTFNSSCRCWQVKFIKRVWKFFQKLNVYYSFFFAGPTHLHYFFDEKKNINASDGAKSLINALIVRVVVVLTAVIVLWKRLLKVVKNFSIYFKTIQIVSSRTWGMRWSRASPLNEPTARATRNWKK